METYSKAQASLVILLEISAIVRQVSTSIAPLFIEASGIMEPIFSCLLHPIFVTRIAAAWCLRLINRIKIFISLDVLHWQFHHKQHR